MQPLLLIGPALLCWVVVIIVLKVMDSDQHREIRQTEQRIRDAMKDKRDDSKA